MYFCSGPPRTYAASATRERIENIALSMHPSLLVFARVTASEVALYSASPRLPGTGRRLLASCRRAGRWIEKQLANEATKDVKADWYARESETRQLWAAWVVGNRLAVVEKESQSVEFYAFDGLTDFMQRVETRTSHLTGDDTIDFVLLDQLSLTEPEQEETVRAVPKLQLAARFVEDYPLNQGGSQNDYEDTAASMSVVPGSKFVFVGMSSGVICVVEVTEAVDTNDGHTSWFSNADSSTKLWKIDVRTHLKGSEASKPISCFDLSCASSDPSSKITSLYLIASFADGKCFIMLISPLQKTIEQLLSLVNTEKENAGSIESKCCATKFDALGYNLALGWSDGSVSLFHLSVQQGSKKDGAQQSTLSLLSIRELSLKPWGYEPQDIGAVTALAWSHDGQSVAVGYALRGFSLFSVDGCRLMSSLPQHQQDRPKSSDLNINEVCAFGVLDLQWTHESHSLLVVPRGEETTQVFELSEEAIQQQVESDCKSEELHVAQLMEIVHATIQKTQDGLCLSLSGAPGRCGAWVRSDKSFTTRTKDGAIGPAEACGLIHGGDLLVAINDNLQVVNLPFEKIVQELKVLPNDEDVTLSFMRLNWEQVFPLAIDALKSLDFMALHGIHLRDDETLCIREYALRMQALQGDCDVSTRPSMLEFEQRAKFDGWEAVRGISCRVAQHKYVKLLFALFPVWNPTHFLTVLTEFGNAVAAQKLYVAQQARTLELQSHREIVKMRKTPLISFAEYEFATSVPLCGKSSRLVLLEHHSIRLVATPSLDDPCAVTSCVQWSVPLEFEKCCPLRLAALSASGKHVAVAGQRGFCLLNVVTGKWRMFGNVNDEQDMVVYALLWVKEDAIMVHFTRLSEQHHVVHLQVYPRNYLDANAVLDQLMFPRKVTDGFVECFMMMESDTATRSVFCISQLEIWWVQVHHSGTIQQNDVQVSLQVKRQVTLPSRIIAQFQRSRNFAILDIAVLPRFSHLQDGTGLSKEVDESEDVGWLASVVNTLVGGQVPDQYTPEQVLPRFAFLDNNGDVIVWDPETRSQRLVCSNVSTMARVFVSPSTCASWPTPCRLVFGLYGPEGMKLWLPLLDGVYFTHTKAFDDDQRRLETFLACHDPLRAKTYEIEFGTAPATAELYEQVLREYGIHLNHFLTKSTRDLQDGTKNLRGCVMTVDDWSAKDQMLRFDVDVKVLGAEQTFGLLVGVSQDVYVPSGAFLPCYDVFARVQPLFHTLLCYLVQNSQVSWAKLVLDGVRHQFALATATQELFLHSILESCFLEHCSHEEVKTAITLLKAGEKSSDIAEYCEIVAHVARKSEPSRLQLLFPAAGDPMELLRICQQRSELRTAANFLLILDECSMVSGSSLPLRMESAAELLKQCIDQEEWTLAQHVVRVARNWNHPQAAVTELCGSNIDEQLASYVWDNLMLGEYERVVWCVEDLQAKLPLKTRNERMSEESTINVDNTIIVDRLVQTFIQGNKRRQLRILLQAVTEAHYDEWESRIKEVMEQPT